jgi:hypothetical protein
VATAQVRALCVYVRASAHADSVGSRDLAVDALVHSLLARTPTPSAPAALVTRQAPWVLMGALPLADGAHVVVEFVIYQVRARRVFARVFTCRVRRAMNWSLSRRGWSDGTAACDVRQRHHRRQQQQQLVRQRAIYSRRSTAL